MPFVIWGEMCDDVLKQVKSGHCYCRVGSFCGLPVGDNVLLIAYNSYPDKLFDVYGMVCSLLCFLGVVA
jgi:hypothetical protein